MMKSQEGVDKLCDETNEARRKMIFAFTQLSDMARKAGVHEEAITVLHGRFFDGNEAIKSAYLKTTLLARLYVADS